jgi:hypothetical protein
MTIKVKLDDGSVILTGDSYKPWYIQLTEYCNTHSKKVFSISVCGLAWIGYGGLKWCSEESFQSALIDEGQGRIEDDFNFREPTFSDFAKIAHVSV